MFGLDRPFSQVPGGFLDRFGSLGMEMEALARIRGTPAMAAASDELVRMSLGGGP